MQLFGTMRVLLLKSHLFVAIILAVTIRSGFVEALQKERTENAELLKTNKAPNNVFVCYTLYLPGVTLMTHRV